METDKAVQGQPIKGEKRLPRNHDKPENNVPLEPDDETEHLEAQEPPADSAADYLQDFKVFMIEIKVLG